MQLCRVCVFNKRRNLCQATTRTRVLWRDASSFEVSKKLLETFPIIRFVDYSKLAARF